MNTQNLSNRESEDERERNNNCEMNYDKKSEQFIKQFTEKFIEQSTDRLIDNFLKTLFIAENKIYEHCDSIYH